MYICSSLSYVNATNKTMLEKGNIIDHSCIGFISVR